MEHVREQVYLAALLHDERLRKLTGGLSLCDNLSHPLETLIKEAECLAIGRSPGGINQMDISRGSLVPLACTILHEGEKHCEWGLSAIPLSLTRKSFPHKGLSQPVDEGALWRDFAAEIEAIDTDDVYIFSEILLALLYKYASNLPGDNIDCPGVSLYDQRKSTAALAVCLYDTMTFTENMEHPFLLIGGDLSGIQSYIYQISSKYAGKNLKGRSFYLRLLTDAVVRYLLKELDLFRANIVYNSGGGFYLLAPNTSAVVRKLNEAVKHIERKMFLTHGLSLFLAIDFIKLPKSVLQHTDQETLGDMWHKLFTQRDMKKNAKLSDLILEQEDSFFEPFMPEENGMVDICTGEYFMRKEERQKLGELSPIRQTTKEQILLGQALKHCDHIIISENPLPLANGLNPIELGFYYYLLEDSDIRNLDYLEKVSIITLNKNQFLVPFGKNCIYGMEFYGGNQVKCDQFEKLCVVRSDDSFHRLGVLRMDVDNLGTIFQQGLSPEHSSLSSMSALSRTFDYFFSGYLNTVWKDVDPDHSLIIYSGGDDLFIVGDWRVTIELAERIHTDFKLFMCNNPAFSISGGIAFIEDKFPIMKGAELSANEESNAKDHLCGGTSKNSLSFLGMAMNFDAEYPLIKALKTDIVRIVGEGKLPTSFISKILSHWINAEWENHEINNVKTYWMLAYDLGRMKERIKDVTAKQLIEYCRVDTCSSAHLLRGTVIQTVYHPLELWALACRWAELELRSLK